MDAMPQERFRNFPFDTDTSYQSGLQAMLATGVLDGKSEQEKEQFLQQTRLFYFNRITGLTLTTEDIQVNARGLNSSTTITEPSSESSGSVQAQEEQGPSISAADLDSPRTLSFAEIKELIEQGRTDQIPNNRIIPNDLSTDGPSQSTASVRKKPWEM